MRSSAAIAPSLPTPTAATSIASTMPAAGDVILNPFDPRAARWDLFGEMTTLYDADQLARSLIADTEGTESPWRNYARVFLDLAASATAPRRARRRRRALSTALVTPVDDLRDLSTTPPRDPTSPKTTANSSAPCAPSPIPILPRSNPSRCILRPAAFRCATGSKRAGTSGVLFLPYRANEIATLRSIISTWMRLAIFEAMSLTEGDRPSLVRHRRTRRPRPHRRPERRTCETTQIRRPLRLRLSIHCPSLRHLWSRRGADHCRELRQHPYIKVFRFRGRRHRPFRLQPHRRTRDPARASDPQPRWRRHLRGRSPLRQHQPAPRHRVRSARVRN